MLHSISSCFFTWIDVRKLKELLQAAKTFPFIRTFPPSSEDLMMERGHGSPACPDATDLMCGLIQELSSLKSVTLPLLCPRISTVSGFLSSSQSALWTGPLEPWRKRHTEEEMCFGFSLAAERSWRLTESWRICTAAVKAQGALYAEGWFHGCPRVWCLMKASMDEANGFSRYQQNNCSV